jgi:phage shock protein C
MDTGGIMNDRLFRSRSDRMLAGVAGGMAERLDLDPALVRIGWVVLGLVSFGTNLVIYVVMAIVVPLEPVDAGGWSPASSSWAPSGGADWAAPDPAAAPAASPPPPGSPSPGPAAPANLSPREARRAARNARRAARRSGYGPGVGATIGGLILVVLGVYFLIAAVVPDLAVDLDRAWPALLIGLGVILVVLSLRRTPGGNGP